MQEIGQIIKDENEKISEENKKITERKNKDENNDEKLIPYLDINVIPCNAEKHMAFYLGKNLAFIDSFQFMSSSLEELVDNLPNDKFFASYSDIEFGEGASLLRKKGVYSYDYMDSVLKFNDTQLPPAGDFCSLLNDECMGDDDYRHVEEVWNTFGIKNMGEYQDLYLKSDILLLADIFRETCLENYGLDPTHYLTSAGLAWDAMLKKPKINLDLITDIDMQLFIDKRNAWWYFIYSTQACSSK